MVADGSMLMVVVLLPLSWNEYEDVPSPLSMVEILPVTRKSASESVLRQES